VKAEARVQEGPSSLQDLRARETAELCMSQSGAFNLCLSGIVLSRQAFWDHIEACCGDTAAAHRVLPLPFWSDFDCGCGADSVSSCSYACSAAAFAMLSSIQHRTAFYAPAKPATHMHGMVSAVSYPSQMT